MTHDMAKQFWKVYIGMAGKNGMHANMSNPVDDFKASAHAGEFDKLTDDQYYRKEADAEDRECDDSDFSPVNEPTPFDGGAGWTPHSIYDYLDQHIYGQEAAKRAASMLMYHHLNSNSRNIVMAGATGCGKTEIWRTLSKKFNFIRIVNGTQLTCDGWKCWKWITKICLKNSMREESCCYQMPQLHLMLSRGRSILLLRVWNCLMKRA